MGFTKQRFGLFYSLPLDALDWQNLTTSKVRLVLLMLEFADAPTLQRLKGMGVRVILRANEDTIYNDEAPNRILAKVFLAMQSCPIDGVIAGNESENAQDLSYTSANFGQDFAFTHRRRFDNIRIALQRVGIKVISPAFTDRMLTETDRPLPGLQTWWDICTDTDMNRTEAEGRYGYHSADGCGGHIYTHNWMGPIDELRILFTFQRLQTMFHKPIFVDEIGVNSGSPLERMRCYIQIAEMLLDRRIPYGARVECLIPFCSNGSPGNPPAWSPGYLIRDPQAYAELGSWMGR